MLFATPPLATFSTPRATATGGTAFVSLIPPYVGPPGSVPYRYQVGAGAQANWLNAPLFGVTHVTTLTMLAGSTAHTVYVVRPKNFTYCTTAILKNVTAFTGLAGDPGAYATTYRYPTVGGVDPTTGIAVTPPGTLANNVVASGDYCCYQLADGSWQADKFAGSVSAGAVTMTTGTPNRDGGSILIGTPIFTFALATDADPATGSVSPAFDTIVSVRNTFTDNIVGVVSALHQGDPLLIFDGNGTAADFITASGFYASW